MTTMQDKIIEARDWAVTIFDELPEIAKRSPETVEFEVRTEALMRGVDGLALIVAVGEAVRRSQTLRAAGF